MWLSLKILTLLWAINLVPPLLTLLFEERWSLPLDRGRCLPDGKPLFGSHKTIRGFLGGVTAGTVVGSILGFPWWLGCGAGFLSMAGDLASSFIKRRFGASSGDIVPLLDQGFEGLFPFLLLGPYLSLNAGQIFLLLVCFSVVAYMGSLFLNRVLLADAFPGLPTPAAASSALQGIPILPDHVGALALLCELRRRLLLPYSHENGFSPAGRLRAG